MDVKGALIIEGHVQGLSNVRSIGELGVPVYVVDSTRCLAQHSKYCTKFFKCPPYNGDEFVPFLVNLAKKEGLSNWLVMASNDHIVQQLSMHKEELMPYYKLILPNYSELCKIINKWSLAQMANSVGVHVPATCDMSSILDAEHFRYPVLIKGKEGLSFYKAFHKKVIRIDDFQALKQQLERFGDSEDCFVQEEIQNKKKEVVSFTCFAVDGKIKAYWMGVKLREHPVEFGTATFAESVLYEGVLNEAAPLVAILHYSGVCEIEFMYDDRDKCYKLIEINPRTWLWVGLAKACGCDYAKLLYNYAYNNQQDYPNNYIVGLKWINLMTDLPYSIAAILKRQLPVSSYFKSIRGKKIHAVWDWHDLLPGLLLPFMSFHILRNRR